VNNEVGGEKAAEKHGKGFEVGGRGGYLPGKAVLQFPELANSSQVGRFSTTSVVKGKPYAQIA
jgi:hypothetical protein